jgi:hypothetical protein
MSRLPRVAHSLDGNSEIGPTLKRKAEDDENFKISSKVPALGAGTRPVKPLSSTTHTHSNGPPESRTRAPLVNATSINSGISQPSKFKRSTSAPPKSAKPPGEQTSNVTMRNRMPSGGKFGAPRRVPTEEGRLKKFQKQMEQMEAAPLADFTKCE